MDDQHATRCPLCSGTGLPDSKHESDNQMNMNEFQDIAKTTAIYPGQGTVLGLLYAHLGAFNEAAEGLEKILDAVPSDSPADAALMDALGDFIRSGKQAGRLKKEIRDKGYDAGISPDMRLPADVMDALADECGDVQFYVASCATELGRTLSDVAAGNVAKLRDRKARGVLGGSGDKR